MYIMWSMCGGGVMYCWVEVGRGSRAVQAVSLLGIEHLVYGSNISESARQHLWFIRCTRVCCSNKIPRQEVVIARRRMEIVIRYLSR